MTKAIKSKFEKKNDFINGVVLIIWEVLVIYCEEPGFLVLIKFTLLLNLMSPFINGLPGILGGLSVINYIGGSHPGIWK